MFNKRVKVSSIINNQLPEFVRSEFPLVSEFLEQYYLSLESDGNPYDLMNNIDRYVKVDNISNIIKSTTLSVDVDLFDTTITVDSTAGFSDSFGLIQINNEIISYESKTDTTFENCYRGFSGVTSYNSDSNTDELTFSSSESANHSSGVTVTNLNSLLISAFFNNVKKQVSPGFEDREFFEDLNEKLFVKQANNFYTSKGTKESFRILFGAIFGKPVQVILPQDYLFEPSDADWRVTKDLVVEAIQGNPLDLVGTTLYQNNSLVSKSARGTITSVEQIKNNNNTLITSFTDDFSEKSSQSVIKNYFILSLDFDYDRDIITKGTTIGEFSIHPKTVLVSDIKADVNGIVNQNYLDVDSTLGFPPSGNLYLDLPSGSTLQVTYTSKTTNQFLGCTGINQVVDAGEEVKYDDYAYAFDLDGNEVRVRVTGTISGLDLTKSNHSLSPKNTIKLKSLGKSEKDDLKLNNWIFNVPSNYKLKSNISLVNNEIFEYTVETFDPVDFFVGDDVYLISSKTGRTPNGKITSKNGNVLTISGQGELDTSASYTIYRLVSKVKVDTSKYPELENLATLNANISNTYYDSSDKSVYVSFPSLPNYTGVQFEILDLKHEISGFSFDSDDNADTLINLKPLSVLFQNKNSYLTGDLLILKINNTDDDQIIGFVKRISNNQIKLSQTRSNLVAEKYIDFSKYDSTNATIEPFSSNYLDPTTEKYVTKSLQSQNLIRKLSTPESNGSSFAETKSGSIGIFLNGVEIENYKSRDSIFYGKINSFDVLSEGTGYDVINPPTLTVSDSTGIGVSGNCSVSGSLERIDILDQGFNYLEVPQITITGGNSSNAKARASLISYDYTVDFFANSSSVSSDRITFDKPHNFSDLEEVIYETNKLSNITGLSTNSSYFVKVVGINTIQLCTSEENVVSGITTSVSVTTNIGIQRFRSAIKKRKLESIIIENPGSDYTNKKIFAYNSNSGISTFKNSIKIENHGFKTGEIISYTPVSDPIGGLTTSNYYVGSIDEDNFRLYEIVDTEGSLPDFKLQSNQYIEFSSIGGEAHEFKYPDIKVSISGNLQVPTLNTDSTSFQASLQPIFRGQIKSVFVTSNGSGYGDNEIINYSKQPQILLNSGSKAEVGFTVNGGKINSVFVTNSGSGYNSPPDILINGDGSGAKLVPVINNSGGLEEVIVISGGGGYTKNNTTVDISVSGQGAKLFANINEWVINLPRRVPSLINQYGISNNDDGYVTTGINEVGLQYKHIYQGRFLKEILNDTVDTQHSPIIGWAYDGNPIYGPYAYDTPTGGPIRKMISGYEVVNSNIGNEFRPNNISSNDVGLFVNDYEFTNPSDADLDIFNGRYCITPEFPQGVYAYFATLERLNDNPAFPYIIGNFYKSKPIDFNFDFGSNSNDIDINLRQWLRNTYPYNQTKENSSYNYFLNSEDLEVNFDVKTVSSGHIDSVSIRGGGKNYKVDDRLLFTKSPEGKNASAIVSKIKGKSIDNISCTTTTIQNIELEKEGSLYVGYSTSPHNIKNNSLVNISSPLEKEQYVKVFVEEKTLSLVGATNSVGLGTIGETGISTYINVSGNLDRIIENDIYRINSEDLKVLNIDYLSSRLRVLRAQNGTSGLSSYSAGIALTESPKSFRVNYVVSGDYNSKTNKELYFNPSESVGLGTTSGVGITSTLHFSNPGVGDTTLKILTQSIYLPNHDLNTGDKISYQTNGGSPIFAEFPIGIGNSLDSYSELFVAKLTNNLIGISSVKVAINSEGVFAGIGSTTSSIGLLYFTGVGTNTYHSFKTIYDDVLTVETNQNSVNVSTAETHGLSLKDTISLNLESNATKTLVVKYSDYNRRFIVNPLTISSVDTANNTLLIENNNLKFGEKILFEETTEIQGLVSNHLYFVSPVNSNEFKLSETQYDLEEQVFVGLTSEGTGSISRVNPGIDVCDFETITFDLSDESLSYETGGGSRVSSFEFKLFYDKEYSEELYFGNFDDYTLSSQGRVGIDPTASVSFTSKNNTPRKLYYSLVSNDSTNNPQIKKDLINDQEQIVSNEINLKPSAYSGNHVLVGISSTSFSYELQDYPESSSYDSSNSKITYLTSNKNVSGEIGEIKVLNPGYGYKTLPKISIDSDSGTFAELVPESESIGLVKSASRNSIGYNYSVDNTIRPSCLFPSIIKISPSFIFESISVVDNGFGYTSDTNLVLIDGETNKLIQDAELKYNVSLGTVEIIKNTDGISGFEPILIPVNNSNALGISTVSYNSSNKTVTAYFSSTFSDPEDFPFKVGTKVLIEGFSITNQFTLEIEYLNYNSSNFDYALFEIVSIDPNLGGSNGSITYDVSDYVLSGQEFGLPDYENSNQAVVPESYFPKFKSVLLRSSFSIGETITSENLKGEVENWYPDASTIIVSTKDKFEKGQVIKGQTTNSKGTILSIKNAESTYNISSNYISERFWGGITKGFLNDNLQRIHDNDYYQYFSYDLKSEITFDKWNESVSSLNHTAGFKKFSTAEVVKVTPDDSRQSSDQNEGTITSVNNIFAKVDIDCDYNFDLASENIFPIDDINVSNQIIFNSEIIQDYVKSIGNKVLIIDDISEQFNNERRPEAYSVINTIDTLNYRYFKMFIKVKDDLFADEEMFSIFTGIIDSNNAYVNQYLDIYSSSSSLGSYDAEVLSDKTEIRFYPVKADDDNYTLSFCKFAISDLYTGISTISLGDSVNIQSYSTSVPSGTSGVTTFVSIGTSYRSLKLHTLISDTDNSEFESFEMNIVHDGTDAYLTEYSNLETSQTLFAGIGTFGASISGSDLIVSITPNVATAVTYTINSLLIGIGDTTLTTTGETGVSKSLLRSGVTTIASSPSPSVVAISTHLTDSYSSSYYVISIEDVTNQEYEIKELVTFYNEDADYNQFIEYGMVPTASSLGILTTGVIGSGVGKTTNIFFTPNANTDYEIRLFEFLFGANDDEIVYDLDSAEVEADFSSYTGRNNDLKTGFDLKHQKNPIFERDIDATDNSVVDLDTDTIFIPNHFFNTGEEIEYSYTQLQSPIGIKTTTIPGIGSTDILPSTLYIVKLDDTKVRVSASASEALLFVPTYLDLTTLGIGTNHKFTSKKQSTKALISIDNVIQSPVVSTGKTTLLSSDLTSLSTILTVDDSLQIGGSDLLKLDDEIVKVIVVGYNGNSDDLLVLRGRLGTDIKSHSTGTLVSRVEANYNIIDNKIHFAEAPYGKSPQEDPSDPEEVDFSGLKISSKFSGRVFLKSGITDTDITPYSDNYVFDSLSENFDGSESTFTLQSNFQDVAGISTNNAITLVRSIFQLPNAPRGNSSLNDENYTLSENSGITSITFSGSGVGADYDVNTANLPRGGVIVSVGSSAGFGYQPLVSAGGTAIVSGLGTISSISIGNSGSGYRVGIQTVVNVGVALTEGEPSIEIVGTATVSDGNIVSVAITNPGSGYTSSNPPTVVFDDPLSYSNVPLVYSSSTPQAGLGTEATVDIVVSSDTSVLTFEIKNFGYGYNIDDILTVDIGGLSGIPTDTSVSFSEFQLTIDETYEDQFASWHLGKLTVFDPIDTLIDGKRRLFPLKIDGVQTSIESDPGSNIDLKANLIIIINDILQVPGESYIFDGGSVIEFLEPPQSISDLSSGLSNISKSKILFYAGTDGIDTELVDILATVKVGDTLKLQSDTFGLTEDPRTVQEIISSDAVRTNIYSQPGLSNDPSLLREVIWCKQKNDMYLSGAKFSGTGISSSTQGFLVSKARESYEPYINPSAYLIKDISTSDTEIFVDNLQTFFESEDEIGASPDGSFKKIIINSQDRLVSCAATAVVSSAGTITSIEISNSGVGYNTTPNVYISSPLGSGTTATATAIISGSTIGSINVTNPGSGYTATSIPSVLIDSPTASFETVVDVSYEGDFGIIAGINTTSVGVASTGIVFDFYIPEDSYIRDSEVNTVGTGATGLSGIQTGYYFVLRGTNVGSGLTSLDENGQIIGIGSTFIDNVYRAAAVSIAQTTVSGVGTTTIAQVTVSVSDYNGIVSLGQTYYYGEYSWGRIYDLSRASAKQFDVYNNGIVGIETSPIVQRYKPLKNELYQS